MRKLLLVVAVALVACGGGDTTASGDGETPEAATTPQPAATEASPEGATSNGSITLTIGAETWEFDGSLCAYYNAEPGQPGSEWNVSFTQEGGQVYADVTSDIPALSYGVWSAEGDAVVFTYDGDTITAEATFKQESGRQEAGTFVAVCSSWHAG